MITNFLVSMFSNVCHFGDKGVHVAALLCGDKGECRNRTSLPIVTRKENVAAVLLH